MAAIVRLNQGSPEWRAHRKQYRNASETPAVLGVSPWLTPYQLWLQRTGRAEPQVNPAMRRGNELEPAAREAYEQRTGLVMEPLVLVEGEYSASLDGITLDGELVVEIKCPYKGQASELWQAVEAGEIPEHYRWQLQHQLMVAKAEHAHLYVFDGSNGVLLNVEPSPEDWPSIREAWDQFMRFVAEDRPPLLTDRDALVRNDPEWEAAACEFSGLKTAVDEATAALEAAKQRLISLATHARVEGAGVSVTRFFKQGSVDYKRVPQLDGIDLEQFRGPGREETRITLLR